jgi:hypothetical protein
MMFIKQISVFIENLHGTLAQFCDVLGENDVDILALSVADTSSFGIVRAIVNDNEKALRVLQQADFAAKLTDVLAVEVPDIPGGLAHTLHLLGKAGISLEYIYSFVRHINHRAVLIMRLKDPKAALDLFQKNNISVLSQHDLDSLH